MTALLVMAFERLQKAELAQYEAIYYFEKYSREEMAALNKEVQEARLLYDNALVPFQRGGRN